MVRFILDVKHVMNITIVLIEHYMGVVMELTENITVLHYGAILAEGPPNEIKENEEVKKVYLGSENA